MSSKKNILTFFFLLSQCSFPVFATPNLPIQLKPEMFMLYVIPSSSIEKNVMSKAGLAYRDSVDRCENEGDAGPCVIHTYEVCKKAITRTALDQKAVQVRITYSHCLYTDDSEVSSTVCDIDCDAIIGR